MISLQGIDSVGASDVILLPRVEEILVNFPFCHQCHIYDLYKYGNVNLNELLDEIPLRHNTKYISVNMVVQLLSPNVTPAPRRNWHFDGDSFEDDGNSTIHLIVSDSTSLTEFSGSSINLDTFSDSTDMADVEVYINQNQELIKPVSIEPNRIYSFNGSRHIHRAVPARNYELRFSLRVLESNYVQPIRLVDAISFVSEVYDDGLVNLSDVTKEYIRGNVTEAYESIRKISSKEILLNYK